MSQTLETASCNFCGSSSTTQFIQQWGFSIVRCTQCGLIYLNPRPTPAMISGFYAADYYAHSQRKGFAALIYRFRQRLILAIAIHRRGYTLPRHPDYRKLNKIAWRVLAVLFGKRFNRLPSVPEVNTPPRSLDIGCGDGAYVCMLQQLGWQAWGIEPDPSAVQLALDQGCHDVFVGRLEDHHFAAESFNLVTCWDSLEHTYDPAFILREAYRLLKPGGWLYLKVPNPHCLEARIWSRYWVGFDLPRHLYHFPPRLLQDFLVQQNYTLFDFYFVSPPNVVASGVIFGLSSRWQRLAFLNRMHALLTLVFTPLAWLLDLLGKGNTYQVVARKPIRTSPNE